MGVKISLFLSWLLIGGVLCPVIVFCFKIPVLQWSLPFNWYEVLLTTVFQALLSSTITVGLALPLALAFCGFFHSHFFKALQLLCVLPALLPPLVSVMAWIGVWEWFFTFSPGFFTIVGVHVLMNVGLVVVLFSKLFHIKSGGLHSWALVHHVSFPQFFVKFLFYEVRKDILLIFFLIFCFCFTSFAVPLLVGGRSGLSLEVFIAEKLKDPELWSQALTLFSIELVFLFLFFYVCYGSTNNLVTLQKKHLKTPSFLINKYLSILSVLCVLAPSFFVLVGLMQGVWQKAWQEIVPIQATVWEGVWQSLFVGLGTGFFVTFLLCLVAFCMQSGFLRRFLLAYTGSSAFMGFCFLLIGSDNVFFVIVKWIVGLSLLMLPVLYRLMGETYLRNVDRQIHLARLMGAGIILRFISITGPQCISGFLFLSGMASFWAVGDFAYTGLVAGSVPNLALLIQDVFASYRWELASVLTVILAIIGTVCFMFFITLNTILQKFLTKFYNYFFGLSKLYFIKKLRGLR